MGEKGLSKTARASMEAGQAVQPKAKVVRTPEETVANIRSLRAGNLWVPGDQIDVLLGELDKQRSQAVAIIAADTQKLHTLQAAVRALYTVAHWRADRHVEGAHQLWEAVRDAAGIEPGHAPKPVSHVDMEHFATGLDHEPVEHDPEHHDTGGEG